MKKKIFSSLFCVVAVDDDDDNDVDVSSPPSLPLPPFSAKLFCVAVDDVDVGKIRRRGTTINRNRVSTSLDVLAGAPPMTTTTTTNESFLPLSLSLSVFVSLLPHLRIHKRRKRIINVFSLATWMENFVSLASSRNWTREKETFSRRVALLSH